jgi:hypothetical protein
MLRAVLFVLALAACKFDHAAAVDDAGDTFVVDSSDGSGGNAGGPKVRLLDIDDASVSAGPHVDFPVLVSITAPWLRPVSAGGGVARMDGFDIHFSADQAGAMQLAHEVELYSADAGALIAWVRIPSLTAQTTLYLHYGDPALTTDPQSAPAVWSAGYQAVLHLDQIADAAGKNPAVNASTSGTTEGLIEIAQLFDGADDSIDIGSAAAIDDIFAGGGTAECWFFAETFGEDGYGRMFEKGHVAGWSIFVNNTERASSVGFLHGTGGGGWGWWNTGANTITLNAWHHIAVTYNQDSSANDAVMYVDGALSGIVLLDAPAGAMVSDAAQSLRAGNRPALDRAFDGKLDELRLSTVVRSAGWIATSYKNQSQPAVFVTVGSEL